MDSYLLVALLFAAFVTTCQGQLDALMDGMGGGLGMMMGGGGAGGMTGGAGMAGMGGAGMAGMGGAAGLAGISSSELAEMTGGMAGMAGMGGMGGMGGMAGMGGMGGMGAGAGLSGMGGGEGGSMDLNTMMNLMNSMGGGGGGAGVAPSGGMNDMARLMGAMNAANAGGVPKPTPAAVVNNAADPAAKSSILQTMVAPMIADTLSYFKMLEVVKAVLGPHAHPNTEMLAYSKTKGKAPSSIQEMVPYMNMMLDLSKKIGIYMPDGTVKKPTVITITDPLGYLSTTADGKIAMKSTAKPSLEMVRDLIIQRGVLWFKSQKPPPPLPGLANGFQM